MRPFLAALFLSISMQAFAIPGDVAPPGALDGVVDVSDVLAALSMASGSSPPNLVADVAPSLAFGSTRLVRGDGFVDVGDVLLLLRVAVGLDVLSGGTEVDAATALAGVRAARFAFSGLWAVVNGAVAVGELPPLNVPTVRDCAQSGSVTILLTLTSQSIDIMDCDTGEFTIDGLASRQGGLTDPIYDLTVDLDLVNGTGALTEAGMLATEPGVELPLGRMGVGITAQLDVTTTYPSAMAFPAEAQLVNPEDRSWPEGRFWIFPVDGPGVELVFNGTSTASASSVGPTITRTYSVDLVTGVVTEIP